jgi:hypothetical protein
VLTISQIDGGDVVAGGEDPRERPVGGEDELESMQNERILDLRSRFTLTEQLLEEFKTYQPTISKSQLESASRR